MCAARRNTCARWRAGWRDQPGNRPDGATRQIDQLARSAPLHDIGKVAIPDGILLKPGPLTPTR
jgi:putative two-component system response regulator